MDIAMIGLGRMGANMARRLARGGVRVLGQDLHAPARDALSDEAGVQTVDTLDAVLQKLPGPRIFWLMLPAGPVTQATIDRLATMVSPGDIIIDGGNAFYKDSQKRAQALAERAISFVDCGVSGGVWGLENGYTLTLGGDIQAINKLERFAKILAPSDQG
ncbi:MAG TPA: NAD(P)-binding domain-containing protein, partial [Burkholderiales bacterium]|nr:NAD(P)-binding domain-containing protein [Burkholderiales bacterium]